MTDSTIRASRPKDSAALHLNVRGQRHVVALRLASRTREFTRETPVVFGKTYMPGVTAIAHFDMQAQSASP